MAHIAIIDDDLAMELLADNLRNRGYEVTRYASVAAAHKDLASIVNAQLVVLDLIMDPGPQQSSLSGSRHAGMWLYREIRKLAPELPLFVFSAITDAEVVEVIQADKHATFEAKWNAPKISEVVATVERAMGVAGRPALPQPFIVHGHDDTTKLEVKNYLQNKLHLPEPIVLHEQPNVGRTLIEKLEFFSSKAQLVFVLLTPDDKVAPLDATNEDKRRARQNVIFEMGLFMGMLGRLSGRVVLLHKGPIELPSDIAGVVYVDISHGIEAAGEAIRRELEHVL